MITSLEAKKVIYEGDLLTACINLKEAAVVGDVTSNHVFPFVGILNKMFDDLQCVDFVYTENTDNVMFGINVNPTISNIELVNILIGTEDMNLTRYMVELDSKMVDILDADEIEAIIIDEIANIMAPEAITNTRAYIDISMADSGNSLDLRNSVNYSQILEYGIKDTIKKLNSVMYHTDKEDLVGTNEYSTALETKDTLVIALKKLKGSVFGNDVNTANPKMSILDWVFLIYKDIDHEYKDAQETLKNAKLFTGSRFDKDEIDKTVKALGRASSESLAEGARIMEEAKKISLFTNLKQNGLRGVESDLYEYKVRIKNCTNEDDAIYILRCIMTRITILQDYLNNNPDISDSERGRWQADIEAYMNLRSELAAKKIGNKAQYGIFVDYDRLDELDKPKDL